MTSRFGRASALSAFLIVLLFAAVFTPGPFCAQSGMDVVAKGSPIAHEVPKAPAIPYPNGAMYMSRGLTGAFLVGNHKNVGEKSLYQWQGELGYFYRPWLSGGLGYKLTAGEPSSIEQKIFNRYFMNLRLHKSWGKAATYVGGQLGMGNLNLLSDSASDTASHIALPNTPLNNSIRNTKPTVSLDLGGGWRVNKFLGLTFGNHFEYSLVTEEGVGWANAINIHVNPGIAIDVLAFTETLRDLVPALFINAEYQTGYLLFEEKSKSQDKSWVVGASLAF